MNSDDQTRNRDDLLNLFDANGMAKKSPAEKKRNNGLPADSGARARGIEIETGELILCFGIENFDP